MNKRLFSSLNKTAGVSSAAQQCWVRSGSLWLCGLTLRSQDGSYTSHWYIWMRQPMELERREQLEQEALWYPGTLTFPGDSGHWQGIWVIYLPVYTPSFLSSLRAPLKYWTLLCVPWAVPGLEFGPWVGMGGARGGLEFLWGGERSPIPFLPQQEPLPQPQGP